MLWVSRGSGAPRNSVGLRVPGEAVVIRELGKVVLTYLSDGPTWARKRRDSGGCVGDCLSWKTDYGLRWEAGEEDVQKENTEDRLGVGTDMPGGCKEGLGKGVS